MRGRIRDAATATHAGNAVMKAMDPSDYRFEADQEEVGDFSDIDPCESPFERGRKLPTITRLNLCMNCHGRSGAHSINTTNASVKRAPWDALKEGSPEAISKATSAQKRKDKSWKALHKLWQADAEKGGTQSPPTRRSTEATARQQRIGDSRGRGRVRSIRRTLRRDHDTLRRRWENLR
jgi:hypothetical protein